MRTQKQIIDQIDVFDKQGHDIFGTMRENLIAYLDYEHVKPFLNEGVKEEEWHPYEMTDERIKQGMIDYMSFAWDKANNCRGLSSARSMQHYTAWVWLLGDDAVNHFGDLEEYEYYGKDHLVKLCKYLGIDSSQWDDGIRSNTEY